MATQPPRCFWCATKMDVVDAQWVDLLTRTADCDRSPDGVHARQVVHQPTRKAS